ncbi:MAG: sigma-E factor negative regulatory protein [Pseudomonadota bacterium]
MQLSAFVDGELPDNEAELLLRRLSQDDELRQQVSEYLVVGRVMRGEPTIAGLDTLRDRISASLDDSDFVTDLDDVEIPSQGFARPLTGVAVAATVAVIALLGVSQFNTPDGAAEPGQPSVAITQPEPDALLDQYRQSHGDISEAERSAVAIGDRLRNVDVTLPAGSDLVEIPAAESDAEAESGEDDEAEGPTDTAAE